MEYRVKEFDGEFEIQRAYKVTIGSLWWKKEVLKWKYVNTRGTPCMTYRVGLWNDIPLRKFKSLEDAIDKIKIFQKGVIYHAVE